MRVSPGHAVSERRLLEQARDLYERRWAAPSGAPRDWLALEIKRRLEVLESTGNRRAAADRPGQQAQPSR